MTRQRARGGLPVITNLGDNIYDQYGTRIVTPIQHSYVPSQEIMNDEIHPRYPYEGGPMSICRVERSHVDGNGWHGTKRTTTPYRTDSFYQGSYRVTTYGGSNAIPVTDTTCESYGATGWMRYKPAQPDVNLGTFFGEITSVKDMIFKRLDSFKALGSNYLAVQFGWQPFLSDVRSWYESLVRLDTQIAQLQRDNGQWIKRGGSVDKSTTTDTISLSPVTGLIYPADPNAKYHSGKCTKVTDVNVWFSGRFKYYIPNLNSRKWGKLRSLQELWNLKLTPSDVYQLIPFSWLLDWFANVGDIIDNYQSMIDDRLVAKYAYIMRQVTETVTISASRSSFQREQSTPTSGYVTTYKPITASSVVKRITKTRAVANPFGFGFAGGVNSLYRSSIIIALGLAQHRI